MRKLIISAAFLLSFGPPEAFAQSIIDGSDKALAPEVAHKMVASVTADFFDPSAAQFRNVFAGKNTTICGEVNGKNRFGGYAGFRPFRFDTKDNSSSLFEVDPDKIELAGLRYLVFKYSGCADRLGMADPLKR